MVASAPSQTPSENPKPEGAEVEHAGDTDLEAVAQERERAAQGEDERRRGERRRRDVPDDVASSTPPAEDDEPHPDDGLMRER